MTRQEILELADRTFERILTNPDDPNARIIAALRGNAANTFNPDDLIDRADKFAEARARDAEDALGLLATSPDRIGRFSS